MYIQIASAFLITLASTSNAFQITPITTPKSKPTCYQYGLHMSNVADVIKEEKAMVKVVFRGEKKFSSQPISLSDLKAKGISVQDHFLSSKRRDLLLSKDGNVEYIDSPSKTLMNTWSLESKDFIIDPNMDLSKDDSCEVFQTSTFMNFPGVKLTTISTFGCKLVLPSKKDDNDHDEIDIRNAQYQITMIGSELKPEGNPAAVWLFKKLTGTNKNNKDNMDGEEAKESTSSSFTTFTVEPTNNPDEVIFTTNASIETRMEFPPLFVKLLPVNLEKMQDQGSKSMMKVLDKEVGPLLQQYVDALLTYKIAA